MGTLLFITVAVFVVMAVRSGTGKAKRDFLQTCDLAEKGYPAGMYLLACYYREGHGTDVDMDKALYWLQKAADKNHPKAVCALGFYYLDVSAGGESVGAGLLKRAAGLGDKEAECYLIEQGAV